MAAVQRPSVSKVTRWAAVETGLDSTSHHASGRTPHSHALSFAFFLPFSSSSLLFSRVESHYFLQTDFYMFLARLLSRWTLSWPLPLGQLILSQDPRLSPPWSSSHHLRHCALSSKVRKALIQYFEMMKMPRILFFFSFFFKVQN